LAGVAAVGADAAAVTAAAAGAAGIGAGTASSTIRNRRCTTSSRAPGRPAAASSQDCQAERSAIRYA
jgi:hypothetical protein